MTRDNTNNSNNRSSEEYIGNYFANILGNPRAGSYLHLPTIKRPQGKSITDYIKDDAKDGETFLVHQQSSLNKLIVNAFTLFYSYLGMQVAKELTKRNPDYNTVIVNAAVIICCANIYLDILKGRYSSENNLEHYFLLTKSGRNVVISDPSIPENDITLSEATIPLRRELEKLPNVDTVEYQRFPVQNKNYDCKLLCKSMKADIDILINSKINDRNFSDLDSTNKQSLITFTCALHSQSRERLSKYKTDIFDKSEFLKNAQIGNKNLSSIIHNTIIKLDQIKGSNNNGSNDLFIKEPLLISSAENAGIVNASGSNLANSNLTNQR